MDGILNIYKEKGYTSHDVVAKLRGILKQKKIGHTGTLDPAATGVLPVCVGKATKLCDLFADRSKTYETVMQLGVTTDTEDMTGMILDQKEVLCSEQEAEAVIHSFVGLYEQIPPMYSALKVNGKKLYELAREGKTVERKPRKVTIHSIEIVSMDFPFITMKVDCSKGTYIRSLCRDIGEQLGCGATMKELKRTRVGQFTVENALTLAQVEELVIQEQIAQYFIAIDTVFSDYPVLVLPAEYDRLLDNGNPFRYQSDDKDARYYRVYKEDGMFIGLYVYQKKEQRYNPYKLFFVEGR